MSFKRSHGFLDWTTFAHYYAYSKSGQMEHIWNELKRAYEEIEMLEASYAGETQISEHLEEQLKIAVDALKWYGNKNNWIVTYRIGVHLGESEVRYTNCIDEFGKYERANEALKKIKELDA